MGLSKILYVTPSMQSFVKNDLAILSKHYRVKLIHQPWADKRLAPLNFIRQFFAMLFGIWGAKVILVNFGGYWAFWGVVFGKVFGKKVFIVTHGTDCAAIPEIGYGSLRIGLLRKICEFTYARADAIFPVSESLIETELGFDPRITSRKQGLLAHFPNLNVPMETIYNGLDETQWLLPERPQRRKNSFITVLSPSQFTLKGGDLILEIAGQFPDCSFYFAGVKSSQIALKSPTNVHFLGYLDPKALMKWYQECEFYFQLSSFEGFGCALCEAMLCGTIPIGADTNHIPTIVGEAGFVLRKKNLPEAKKLVNQALQSSNKAELSLTSRRQIEANYSLKSREQKLIASLRRFTH